MRSFNRGLFGISAVLLVFLLIFTACGGDDDDDDPTATSSSGSEATATSGGDDGDMAGDAAAGEEIYNAQCAACHTTDGTDLVGPTWLGLWGSTVTLDDGTTVEVDEAYVVRSIEEPDAQIREGFTAGLMAANLISGDEITDVIAYMKTLN